MSLAESKGDDNYFDMYIQRIKDRLWKKNQNWLCTICGGTGSGKTYNALSIADELMEDFNCKQYVVFNIKDFMKVLTSDYIKQGDIVIFEEAGVGMSSKNWMSIQNKVFNFVLQTFRHKNIGVIFTMPGWKLLDNSARTLIHTYMETITIHRDYNLNQCKVLDISYNSINDKIYKKFPVFYDSEGNQLSMKYLFVKKPRAKIVNEYEKMKTEYTSELNKSVMQELEQISKPEPQKPNPCDICGTASWVKRKDGWLCRKCGDTTTENPFLKMHTQTPTS